MILGIFIGFIVGFIVAVVACVVYGQYTLRDMALNKQIVTECSGFKGDKRPWFAYVPGARLKYYSPACLSENEAAGHVYLQVKRDLQIRYKKPGT